MLFEEHITNMQSNLSNNIQHEETSVHQLLQWTQTIFFSVQGFNLLLHLLENEMQVCPDLLRPVHLTDDIWSQQKLPRLCSFSSPVTQAVAFFQYRPSH